jgi:hypothetical protein
MPEKASLYYGEQALSARAGVLQFALRSSHRTAHRQGEIGGVVVLFITREAALQAMGEPVPFFGVHEHVTAAPGAAF